MTPTACSFFLLSFLLLGLTQVKSSSIGVLEKGLLTSVLDYFQSHTVIFVTDESDDLDELLNTQKFFNEKGKLSSFLPSTDIYSILKYEKKSVFVKTIVVSLWRNHTRENLEMLSKRVNISPYVWLIISNQSLKMEDFENVEIPFNCEFLFAEMLSNNGYAMTEVYKTTSALLNRSFGKWSLFSGLRLSSDLDFFSRRSNLQKAILKIITPEYNACATKPQARAQWTGMLCIHNILWELIMEKLNATSQLIWQPSRRFKDFMYKIDAIGSTHPFTMGPNDLQIHSVFWPTMKFDMQIFTKYTSQAIGWNTYVEPFSKLVWFSIFLWLVVATLIMAALNHVYIYIGREIHQDNGQTWTPLIAFCNQGVSNSPERLTERILFFLLFLVPGVFVPSYSAEITSFLSIQTPKMPFTDLEGLSKTNYKLSGHRFFQLRELLERDKSPVTQKILKHSILAFEKMPVTEVVAFRKMCSEKYSYVSTQYASLSAPSCKFFTLRKPLLIIHSAMPMRNDTPYKVLLNRYMRNLRFSGIQQKIKLTVSARDLFMGFIRKRGNPPFTPIVIENTVLIMLVLLGGMGVSMCLFIGEIIWYRRKQIKQWTKKIKKCIYCDKSKIRA